jgi:hypothetical protein
MAKNQNIDFTFGSGLNHTNPTKCPLYKNLKYIPGGDNCNDVYTPQETDN